MARQDAPGCAIPTKTGVTLHLLYSTIQVVNYWLVKQEPEAYSWTALVKDGCTAWTGIRNFQARIHLRAMKRGDLVLFYHSVSDKQVVGVARVQKESYPDPTASEGDWVCVDLEPVMPLKEPVSLDAIRSDKALKNMTLVKHTRLSVINLTKEQFGRVLELGKTDLSAKG